MLFSVIGGGLGDLLSGLAYLLLGLGDLLGGGLGDLGLGTMERSYHIGLVRPSSIQQGSGVRLASSERVSKQHVESIVSAIFNL